MPPKRRAVPRTSSGSQQSTLSFHGKQSRVTKPSAAQQLRTAKKDPVLLQEVSQPDLKQDVESELPESAATAKPAQQQTQQALDTEADPLESQGAPTSTESVLGGRAAESEAGAIGGKGSGWVGDEEGQARKISDTQIKKYWRQKEQERLAPRVHQEDLSVYEKVLREWDMSGQYGPCIGIARLKRWKRANLLGLKPPIEVLAVLLKGLDVGETKSQRAHVDELMNSRFAVEA